MHKTDAPHRFGRTLLVCACAALMLAGCKTEVYRGLTETQANAMMAVLLKNGIEPEKTYRIVTTAYLLDGGDQFSMMKDLPPALVRGPLEAELLERFLEDRRDADGNLPLPETGRILGMPFRDDLSAKPRNF